ncbi:amidohydrolase family protein [Candidimonas nitroreducens]|uniref:amidohydrolase family protein n=1 Tax=Candidimonas nitroreducens TaxID=683354 RepID=UPI00130354CF|nr:amidohydrolase family protein [Candidimonas nitroreducens]
MHIFDRRFPRVAGRDGPESDVAALLRLRRRLGVSRTVLVYPSSYGGDNRAMLDALEQLGDTARGVAHITLQTPEAELDRMNSAGVRGARLYLARDNPPDVDDIRAYAYRLASRGWHLEFVVRERQLMDAEAVLMALPCKIVLCHFAHLARPLSMRPPGADAVKRLLDRGHTYLKLSGVYTVSDGATAYVDLDPVAQELIAAAPQRMLWGTDWPHTTVRGTRPDGAELFDMLARWAPDHTARERILVDNPTALYWAA